MLRITLRINADQIGDYEVKRVTNVDRLPRHTDVSTYEVRAIPSMRMIGSVEHVYGQGAERLAAEALQVVAAESKAF